MNLVLDSACPVDRGAIFSLLAEAGGGSWPDHCELSGIPQGRNSRRPGYFFVARLLSDVAGVVGLEDYSESALLRFLAVAPARRGKDPGRRPTARVLEASGCARGAGGIPPYRNGTGLF
ncbi:MAG: hypothetical protein QHH75_11305 [Bacillota bacterium]|nr:hypothetical protein [Bacillota bacterium]